MSPASTGFHVAAFAGNGELEGVGRWDADTLSPKWLRICGDFLAAHGSRFDAAWPGELAHVRTKFTATAGVALATFKVREKIASSLALSSGRESAAEHTVLDMFVRSLRNVEIVRATARSDDPFDAVLRIRERPLLVIVPWADPEISDPTEALVRKLSVHLAGAFFGTVAGTGGRTAR
jgi:hypothetical protein